jgi:hypothetical protein
MQPGQYAMALLFGTGILTYLGLELSRLTTLLRVSAGAWSNYGWVTPP